MALTFTSPSDDIIFQEGTSAYNFKASGTIKKGQVVYPADTMEVKIAPTMSTGVVGVAAYDVTDNEYLAVWGPGNIVRCMSSGSITVGDDLCVNSAAGHVGSSSPAAGAKIGVALETVATATSVKVLLT